MTMMYLYLVRPADSYICSTVASRGRAFEHMQYWLLAMAEVLTRPSAGPARTDVNAAKGERCS